MPGQRIESVIHDVLKDDTQKHALDFIAYLRANEIPLEESESYWEVKYKDQCVCFILITGSDAFPGPWTIWSDQAPGTWVTWDDGNDRNEHENLTVDEHIKQIAWANVNFCANCGGNCSPGKRKTILGRDFDHVCSSAVAFTNPDSETVNCAKKMVDARKRDILRRT